MNISQEHPISYEMNRVIKSMLQGNNWCTGWKRILHQNEGNLWCVGIELFKGQPNGERLIRRGQLSDWSAKSIS